MALRRWAATEKSTAWAHRTENSSSGWMASKRPRSAGGRWRSTSPRKNARWHPLCCHFFRHQRDLGTRPGHRAEIPRHARRWCPASASPPVTAPLASRRCLPALPSARNKAQLEPARGLRSEFGILIGRFITAGHWKGQTPWRRHLPHPTLRAVN